MIVYGIFVALLVFSASISLFLLIYAVRQRTVAAALPFALLLLGEFIWTVGYLCELLVVSLDAKIFYDNVQFLGSDAMVAGSFLFALIYTGHGTWVNRYGRLLTLLPIGNQIVIWTDARHQLLRSTATLDTSGFFPVLSYGYGAWFWFWAGYGYLLLLIALGMLLIYAARRHNYFRLRSIMIIVAMTIPLFGTLLTLLGLVPIPRMEHLDITPITFSIANPIWAWALFRQRLIDLTPIARDLLIEQLPDGVLVLDAQQRIVDINPTAQRLLPHSSEPLIGATVTSAFPVLAPWFVDNSLPVSEPLKLSVQTDTTISVVVTTSPLTNRRGRTIGWLVLLRDVSAQEQAEAALRTNQALLQSLLDHSPASIAVMDTDGCYLLVNHQFVADQGLQDVQDVTGRSYTAVLPADLSQAIEAEFQAVLDTRAPCVSEFAHQRDHGRRAMMVTSFPLFDPTGAISAVGFIHTDISERKQVEEMLRTTQARLNFLLESAPAVIFSALGTDDHHTTFISANVTALTGYPPESFVADPCFWFKHIHPDDMPNVLNAMARIPVEHHQILIYRFAHADGTYRWMQVELRLVQNASHQPEIVGVWIDIDQQRRAEETLHRYRHIVSVSPDLIALIDTNYVYQIVNQAYLKRNLKRYDEIVGHSVAELMGTELFERLIKDKLDRCLAGETVTYRAWFEYVAMGWRFMDMTYTPYRADAGVINGILVSGRDITEIKLAEEALRTREEQLHLLVQSMPVLVEAFDTEGRIVVWNDTCTRVTGYTAAEIVNNRHALELLYPDPTYRTDVQQTLINHQIPIHEQEWTMTCKDGSLKTIAWSSMPVAIPGWSHWRIGVDVTARKQAETEILRLNAELEQRVQQRTAELSAANHALAARIAELERADAHIRFQAELLDMVGQAVIATDPHGYVTYWNRFATVLYGWSSGQAIGHQIWELLHIPARDIIMDHYVQRLYVGEICTDEISVTTHDGRAFPVLFTLAPFIAANGEFAGIISVSMDIRERKQAEAALAATYAQIDDLNQQLQRSNALLRTLFDNLPDGLGLIDREGCILAMNQPLARLYQVEARTVIGQPWGAICSFSPTLVEQTLQDGQPHYGRTAMRSHKLRSSEHSQTMMLDFWTLPVPGEHTPVEQIIIHVIDVTEKLQLEAQVIAQERFAANGWLAATVAHEVNSPLQAIENCLHLAMRSSAQRRTTYLNLAREEIQRVGSILRQLLDLYRPESHTSAPVDINMLIERELLLLGRTLARQGIRVDHDLAADLPPLWGRADELSQVLLNLIANAIQAMPRGGHLQVRTFLQDQSNGTEQPCLVIEVTDTGVGIPPEVQERIFEPFFTTRSDGSGLGLSISNRIVTAHGGTLSCRSTPGAGSTFTITFAVQQHTDRQKLTA